MTFAFNEIDVSVKESMHCNTLSLMLLNEIYPQKSPNRFVVNGEVLFSFVKIYFYLKLK